MPPRSSTAGPAVGRGSAALIALFFVSGAASLVYETVWNRLLVLQMGNTAYALTTILTVFMGGLALGSFLGGRVAARLRDPLRTYGWLELGIGVYCALVPALIESLEPVMHFVYNHYFGSLALFSFFQFLACGAVLLLPITAMGATLPIVSDFVARSSKGVASSVGLAYGVNTLGGFVGVIVGGLLLVPIVGLSRANVLAAALSASAGLGALAISSRLGAPGPAPVSAPGLADERSGPGASPIPPWLLLLGLGVSGFAAMTYQVAWTRVLTLSIGSVTYSFPLIVGAFIGGLAAGAALLGRLGDRAGWNTRLLVICQLGIAGVAATTIPALGELPVRMTLSVLRSDSFASLQLAKFAAVFGVVFAPTFLMGGMLPLAVRAITAAQGGSVGATVGRAYASNTLGTIIGSFAAGFLLVPNIGMQRTIALAVAMNAVVGAAFLIRSGLMHPLLRVGVALGAAAALVGLAFSAPGWDRAIITSAPYLHAPLYASGASADEAEVRATLARKARIVYYREDVATTVTVLNDGRNRYLYVGGKLDALSRSSSQSLLGHLPMLLHPAAEKVLVVGLGSSETLAATLLHDSAREVDCIEISPAVVEAADGFFQRAQRPLQDPRVDLRIGDGRVHVAMTDERYDVIVSQPGNPWMAGASALFTREYFEQLKSRLAPGGVASVWVQAFSASPESVETLLATFASVFEHVDLWETRVIGDYILTGYLDPLKIDLRTLDERLRRPKLARSLRPQSIRDAADLAGYLVTTGEQVRRLPQASSPNTDDLNFLETRLQRELFVRREYDVLSAVSRMRVDPATRIEPAPGSAQQAALLRRLAGIYESKPLVREAMGLEIELGKLERQGRTREARAATRRLRSLRKRIEALDPRASLLER